MALKIDLNIAETSLIPIFPYLITRPEPIRVRGGIGVDWPEKLLPMWLETLREQSYKDPIIFPNCFPLYSLIFLSVFTNAYPIFLQLPKYLCKFLLYIH